MFNKENITEIIKDIGKQSGGRGGKGKEEKNSKIVNT